MNAYLNYLLEANLSLAIFFCFYHLVLRKETNFSALRIILLGGILISLIFPLLHFNSGPIRIPSLSNAIPTLILSEFNLAEQGTASADTSFSIYIVLVNVYYGGVVFFLLIFMMRFYKLAILIFTSKFVVRGRMRIAQSPPQSGSFSFFNYIFIARSNELSESDREQIIAHETVHATQRHSFDVLLLNILGILFWFNPLIRAYKNIFVHVHEYEADARSVKNSEVNDYCNLLARVALLSADLRIANHFSNSLTLKRIQMMRRIKNRISLWKMVAFAALVPGCFFVISCQEQLMTDATDIAKSSTIALDIPPDIQAQYEKQKAANPDKKLLLMEVDANGQAKVESLRKKIEELPEESITSVNVIKQPSSDGTLERAFIIVQYDEHFKTVQEKAKSDEGVYSAVEETATPAGGIEKYYSFIAESLTYPKEAREKGIEGKVLVSFVVETDGSVSDVIIIKGIDEALDKEALRVIRNSPTWLPGKNNGVAVRQRVVLPINFSLGDKKSLQKTGFLMKPWNPFEAAKNSKDRC